MSTHLCIRLLLKREINFSLIFLSLCYGSLNYIVSIILSTQINYKCMKLYLKAGLHYKPSGKHFSLVTCITPR